MKLYRSLTIFLLVVFAVSCTRPTQKISKEEPYPVKYENELFSINMPKGWEYDDSGWKGLDSLQNEVDLFSRNAPVWFHIVKAFMPIQWKNIDEATEMAITARALSGDNTQLIDRIDSVEVGGYPTTILYFANFVDNDTIIQKQFVTYLEDSHIVVYFNENFYPNQWESAQEYGDRIIETVKLKKVKNPLEQDGAMKKVVQDASIEEKYIERGKQVLDEMK